MRPEQEQELAYTLLVELLAYQFASPVRWFGLLWPSFLYIRVWLVADCSNILGLKPKMLFYPNMLLNA